MIYLIRDNFPEILAKDDVVCNYAAAQNKELYNQLLKGKLIEHIHAFVNTDEVDHLVEAITAIKYLCKELNLSDEEFNKLYEEKLSTEGGFENKYMIIEPDRPQQIEEDTE